MKFKGKGVKTETWTSTSRTKFGRVTHASRVQHRTRNFNMNRTEATLKHQIQIYPYVCTFLSWDLLVYNPTCSYIFHQKLVGFGPWSNKYPLNGTFFCKCNNTTQLLQKILEDNNKEKVSSQSSHVQYHQILWWLRQRIATRDITIGKWTSGLHK